MVISEDILLAYGATEENYNPKDPVFYEGNMPKYYFQIKEGVVELTNYHEDGKEFIQNILTTGESIGESFLFDNRLYPTNAVAKSVTTVWKLPKSNFFTLLQENPEVSLNMFHYLAGRLYNKYIMLFNISSTDPVFKIRSLMESLKDSPDDSRYSFQVPLTRKQLANLTGLRIETVIRAIKKMHHSNIVKIKNRKIYY